MNDPTGMSAFITALTTGITSDTLWAEITKAAPFVIVVVTVAVGYRIVKKLITGVPKFKARI